MLLDDINNLILELNEQPSKTMAYGVLPLIGVLGGTLLGGPAGALKSGLASLGTGVILRTILKPKTNDQKLA